MKGPAAYIDVCNSERSSSSNRSNSRRKIERQNSSTVVAGNSQYVWIAPINMIIFFWFRFLLFSQIIIR